MSDVRTRSHNSSPPILVPPSPLCSTPRRDRAPYSASRWRDFPRVAPVESPPLYPPVTFPAIQAHTLLRRRSTTPLRCARIRTASPASSPALVSSSTNFPTPRYRSAPSPQPGVHLYVSSTTTALSFPEARVFDGIRRSPSSSPSPRRDRPYQTTAAHHRRPRRPARRARAATP